MMYNYDRMTQEKWQVVGIFLLARKLHFTKWTPMRLGIEKGPGGGGKSKTFKH